MRLRAATAGYTESMSRRLRKAVALVLSVWLLLLGGAYAPSYSGEVQHDLEQIGDSGPAKGVDASDHSCAGHLSAHLVAILRHASVEASQPRKVSLLSRQDVFGVSLASDPFLPPPKLFLA